MNSVLILLFFLPLISAQFDLRTVNRICLENGKQKFLVNLTAKDSVYDIFSTDPQNSCSLLNNDFTGNGTEDSPYEITVDLYNSTRKCGAVKTSNVTYKVEFVIKSNEIFFDKTKDYLYESDCTMQGRHISTLTQEQLDTGPLSTEMRMKLVSAKSTEISDKMNLGDLVKLQVSNVKNARVTLCYVGDKFHKNYTIFNNKCSIKSDLISIKFKTNETDPTLIESTTFKAFKMADSGDDIKFTCYVEICSKKEDPYCLASGCVPKGIFLHYYDEITTKTYTVISGANNQMSFTLMPVTAVLIFLTNLNWF